MYKSLSLTKRIEIDSIFSILLGVEAIARKLNLHRLLKNLLRLTIKAYQHYLSPYKGFSCAHRILHQQESCSSYFMTCLAEQSLRDACTSLQQRLQDCQQAHLVLNQHGISPKLSRRKAHNGSCTDNNSCVSCREIFDLEFWLDVFSPACNC